MGWKLCWKEKLSYFLIFVVGTTISTLYHIFLCILHIVLVFTQADWNDLTFIDRLTMSVTYPPPYNIIVSLALIVYMLVMCFFLLALCGSTCGVLCNGKTSHEHAKIIKDPGKAFDFGPWMNVQSVLCGPWVEKESYLDLNAPKLPDTTPLENSQKNSIKPLTTSEKK